MAKSTTKVSMITPKGPSIYPKVNAPDYKFDPRGKYSSKIRLDASDPAVQAFVSRLEKLRDDFFASEVSRLTAEKKAALAKELGVDSVIKIERDDETGEETGFLIFSASMYASGERKDGSRWEQKPAIFDAKGNELKNPPAIYGGTVMKLSVDVDPFVNQTSKKVCLSTRLTAVQVINLVTGGQRSFSGYGFGAEDGDEIADQPEASPFSNETSGGNDDL